MFSKRSPRTMLLITLLASGFCAFMISRNKIEEKLQAEGKSISVEDVEAIKNADLENGCETICGMISDFFDYIRTETEEI